MCRMVMLQAAAVEGALHLVFLNVAAVKKSSTLSAST
jgi:hypothetical protein